MNPLSPSFGPFSPSAATAAGTPTGTPSRSARLAAAAAGEQEPADPFAHQTPRQCFKKLENDVVVLRREIDGAMVSWLDLSTLPTMLAFAPMPSCDESIKAGLDLLVAIAERDPESAAHVDRLVKVYTALGAAFDGLQAALRLEDAMEGAEGEDVAMCADILSESADRLKFLDDTTKLHGLEPHTLALLRYNHNMTLGKLKSYLEDMFDRVVTITSAQPNRLMPLVHSVQIAPLVTKDTEMLALSRSAPPGTSLFDQPPFVATSTIVYSLATLGLLESHVAELADRVFATLVEPVLLGGKPFEHADTTVAVEPDAAIAHVLSFTAVTPESARADPPWIAALDHLARITAFFSTHLVAGFAGDHAGLRESLCETWTKRVVPLVVDRVLLPHVPDSPDTEELAVFAEKLHTQLTGFTETMRATGLLTPAAADELLDFLPTLAATRIRKRRAALLEPALQILRRRERNVARATPNPDLPSMEGGKGKGDAAGGKKGGKGGGTDVLYGLQDRTLASSLLDPPAYLVTEQTQSLVDMLAQVLHRGADSVEWTETTAFGALDAVRDLVFLWLAVVPPLLDRALRTSPRAAALFRNDTEYLVHHLLAVPRSLAAALPEDSQRAVAPLADLIPPLRKYGTRTFDGIVAAQIKNIEKLVAEALLVLGEVDQDAAFQTVQAAFLDARHLFEELEEAWRGCLPDALYLHTLGRLLSHYYDLIATAVLALPAISAPAAHALRYLLDQSLDMNALFQLGGKGAAAAAAPLPPPPALNAPRAVSGVVAKHCPGHRRVHDLVQLLAAFTPDQAEAAVAGVLDGITEAEARELIAKREF
ncbi:Centromere/kinetochore protein zw10 [Blastocladiella emersonii ATCC 22665]|nr:Centromere/kinetochore protein zw10 [Blastocladiella emersonii ATCC 22665]